ncbi:MULTISPECIES: hypothetical protein [unclassified Moorena]|uniref:hypothetical protein n=1 Tax=unclassified Moorena TaxID=2683338 RepID=UPI0013BC7FFC|nr:MULTISPECIES: hypothetical protein [unclassified Moorena]NEP30380.1 hypothetical protein [Moorena sp. SIO3B2]NEQ08042.1 hypothetical protein [Moorena sp. SIO4E2]NER87356.1 hypothetical protein [Moorena sp. SIO3A2]
MVGFLRRTFPSLRALLLLGLAVAGLSPGCAKAKGHATRTVFQPVPYVQIIL